MKVTLHRFGRNRRLVLILEWLTLWPTIGPLAVSSQRRDIAKILCHPASVAPVSAAAGVQNHVHFRTRGPIGAERRGVKVLRAKTARLRNRIRPLPPPDIII